MIVVRGNILKLLLIDDDPSIHLLIKKTLNPLISLESSLILCSPDKLESFDLIILDLMLEKVSSLDFLNEISEQHEHLLSKIILLTAAGNDDVEIETHRLGVRDYVKKPFNPKVLTALIDKHLGQLKKSSAGSKYGVFHLNLTDFSVSIDMNKIDLTTTEFKVMRMLIESRGRVVTRERLMTEVWDIDDETQTRTVDMHMSSLRKKIAPYESLLKTKRGVGYYLEEK